MKTRIYYLLVLITISMSCFSKEMLTDDNINKALNFSVRQYLGMFDIIKTQPGKFPRSTDKEGKLLMSNDNWWTSGFYPGTLWYLYEYSPSDSLKKAATLMTERLEQQQYTTDNHDVGFIINCSYGNAYRLTKNESCKSIIINAAKSLSTRYNPVTGCIRSWNNNKWEYPVIIDNMMNLELLFEATKLSGDSSFYKIAVSHADTTLKYHFREDGSSYHVVSYDTINGGYLRRVTHQGAFDESAWARGQAWALYGYTMVYRETGNTKYLDHACKVANFIINHPNLPEDKIPYWDFNAANIPNEPRDASAAAIMASAFVELSTYVNGTLSDKYWDIATMQIKSLSSPAYLAQAGSNGNFILKNSVGFMAKNSEVNAPLTYADYYFVEALLRYKDLQFKHNDRTVWIDALTQIANPVLVNLSQNTLRKNMPVEVIPEAVNRKREEVTHLEAVGRLICGIAPWLELGVDDSEEGKLRAQYIDLCTKGLKNAVDPSSPDMLNFSTDRQALVDAAFLAQGLLRAPSQLWNNLDRQTQERLISSFKSTRSIKPLESNWLLFTSMVEAFLLEFTGECDMKKIDYSLKRFDEWYKGDSWYGDGPGLHFDYYNSLVIHPMMIDILEVAKKKDEKKYSKIYETEQKRCVRHAEQLERMISPEGTFPPIGRSLVYRFGAFHLLSQVALNKNLPAYIHPAQVRCAFSSVIEKQINAPGTFDEAGWLQLGFCGYQPELAESYISTGSLYLCASVFLPLGLPAGDEFWSGEPLPWTSKKVWNGEKIKIDKSIKF